METLAADQLATKKCVPCEGGVEALSAAVAQAQVAQLSGWRIAHRGQRIRKEWKLKNFVKALDFINRIGAVAEAEQHHPDLHLEGYRNVAVEIYTHAVGGLSENDFILAAKIDQLPVEVKA